MFRNSELVDAKSFVPGTVVAVFDGSIRCIAVVFQKTAWAELAYPEINANVVKRVLESQDFIPLRIIGCIKGHTGNPYAHKKNFEPSDIIIRKYTYSIVGRGIKIVDNLQDLLDSYLLFSIIHGITLDDYVHLELMMLQKYLTMDYEGKYIQEDNKYGENMLALLKKGIPQFAKK